MVGLGVPLPILQQLVYHHPEKLIFSALNSRNVSHIRNVINESIKGRGLSRRNRILHYIVPTITNGNKLLLVLRAQLHFNAWCVHKQRSVKHANSLMGEDIQRCLKHICHAQLSHYWYSTWIQPVCSGNSRFLMPAVQGHWAGRHKAFIRQDHHSNGIVLLLFITFEKEKVLPKRVLRRKPCHLTVRSSKLETPSLQV